MRCPVRRPAQTSQTLEDQQTIGRPVAGRDAFNVGIKGRALPVTTIKQWLIIRRKCDVIHPKCGAWYVREASGL